MEASPTSPKPPTNGNPTKAQLILIADFKPPSSERAWVSIPNPNGLPLIATATSDKSVRVYSLTNFTLHSKLDGGHQRSVRSVAWKPAQEGHKVLTIATGSFDHTMGIWRRREEGRELTTGNGDAHGADVSGEPPLELEVTRNGVIQNEDDSEANEDWEFSIVLEGHDAEIKSVAYSPSGQWLASCSRDKQIWIWEEIGDEGDDEFETVAVLTDHEADIKCVCWRSAQGYNDQGEVLASSSYDDTIRLWREEDEGEWGCFAVMEGHQGTVWSLNWEPDISLKRFSKGDDENRTPRLLSSSADHTIKVWSLVHSPPPPNAPSYLNSGIPSTMRPAMANETWACTATLPAAHDLPIYSIGWSKESGRVVSAAGDGKVVVYEERKKEPPSSVTVPEVTVDQQPRPDNLPETEWVIIAELWGAHGPYEINHVAWCQRFDSGKSRDGEEMIVTTGDDGNVRAWALEN